MDAFTGVKACPQSLSALAPMGLLVERHSSFVLTLTRKLKSGLRSSYRPVPADPWTPMDQNSLGTQRHAITEGTLSYFPSVSETREVLALLGPISKMPRGLQELEDEVRSGSCTLLEN
eukprot:3466525-Amphidinium_carterae.1